MLNKFKHIKVVDVNYCCHDGSACIYILRAPNNETMIVDTGTPGHLDRIEKALKELNVKKEELTSLFLTHHHYDHAGGAYLLSQKFPDMKIYAHPLTIKVLLEPSGLCNHLRKFLKKKRYESEIGDLIRPVPENRFIEVKDNDVINFANYTKIKALYTPGHCIDHICYYDMKDSLVFLGDSFGSQYPDMIRPVFPCIYMFDAFAVEKSIRKVINCGAKTGAQVHYGYVENLKEFGEQSNKWAQRMYDIAVNSKYPDFEFYQEYVNAFGDDFLEKRNIRGHFITSKFGVNSVRNFTHGICDPRKIPPHDYIVYNE